MQEYERRRAGGWFRGYVRFAFLAAILLSAYFWFAYRSPVPAHLAGTGADPLTFMSAEEAALSSQYSAFRDTLFFLSYLWEWGVLIWLLTSGFAARMLQRLEEAIPRAVFRFPVYTAAVLAVVFACSLPVRLVSYGLARLYGVSTLPPAGWLRDQLVNQAVQTALMTAVFAVVFLLARKKGALWFKLWLLSVPFLIFYMVVRPVVIDPLFYHYEPLSDPKLEQAVLEMTHRAGVPAERVYMADYSRKTNAINAYVDGFGPSLRIVIWDTALQKLTEEEILVLTAHEIAHYVKHHLEWSAAGGIASAFLMLFIGDKLLRLALRKWGKEAAVRSIADWSALPLMLLIFSLLTFASTPIASAVSRQSELAADRYAYALTNDPGAAASMYRKLAVSSRGTLHPAALTYWFRYTHPSLGERILEAESHERKPR